MAWLSSAGAAIVTNVAYRRQKLQGNSWSDGFNCAVYQNLKVTTREYRGLTESAASLLVGMGIVNNMTDIHKNYTVGTNATWWCAQVDAYGTITERVMARANDAGGYTVIETETKAQAQVYAGYNSLPLLETLGTL